MCPITVIALRWGCGRMWSTQEKWSFNNQHTTQGKIVVPKDCASGTFAKSANERRVHRWCVKGHTRTYHKYQWRCKHIWYIVIAENAHFLGALLSFAISKSLVGNSHYCINTIIADCVKNTGFAPQMCMCVGKIHFQEWLTTVRPDGSTKVQKQEEERWYWQISQLYPYSWMGRYVSGAYRS